MLASDDITPQGMGSRGWPRNRQTARQKCRWMPASIGGADSLQKRFRTRSRSRICQKPFFRVTTRTTLHYRDRTKPCPFPSYSIKNHNTTVRFSFVIIFTHVYYYDFRQININKHQSFKRRKQTVCIKISWWWL
ncbi:unnamed protein product [Musa hybrid cultivar]